MGAPNSKAVFIGGPGNSPDEEQGVGDEVKSYNQVHF